MKHLNNHKGIALLLLAHVFFSINFSVVTYLTATFTVFQLMMFRFAMGPVFLLPQFKQLKISLRHVRFLIGRTVFGVSAMTCLYFGFYYGDPGQVTLLFCFSVIWNFIASYFVFHERPHRYSILAVGLSFVGLFLILRPDLAMPGKGAVFALVGSLLNVGMVLNLKQARNHYSSVAIVLIFHLGALPLILPFADLSWDLWTVSTLKWMVLVGGLSITAQYLMTKGYKYCYASIGSASSLIEVPLMYASGFMFFQETLSMSGAVGVVVVLLCVGVITRYQ